jgi:hypothetical protein
MPPPTTLKEILRPIQQDPFAFQARLQEEMEQIRTEKETEKKKNTQLNAELSKSKTSTAKFNIHHAEQLMYMTAGLNLVILPEDTYISPEEVKDYIDGKGSMPESRQRNHSHVAATAG